MAQKFHVKRGDQVVVIAGSQKGKSGKILEILPAKQRARVADDVAPGRRDLGLREAVRRVAVGRPQRSDVIGRLVPEGATVVELGGRYLIPGRFDSHVHWGGSGGIGSAAVEMTDDRMVREP